MVGNKYNPIVISYFLYHNNCNESSEWQINPGNPWI